MGSIEEVCTRGEFARAGGRMEQYHCEHVEREKKHEKWGQRQVWQLLKSREHDRLHANVILALRNFLEIISFFFLPKTIRLNLFRQKIWIFPFFGILNSIRSKFFLLFFLKMISFFAISKNKPWQQYLLTLFYSCSGEIIVDHFPTDNEILLYR